MSTNSLSDNGAKRLCLVPASTVTTERVGWLEPNLWPIGFLSVIAGIGGLGKSTYTYQLAADVSTGHTGGRWDAVSKTVVVFSAEDTWKNVIKPRLIAAVADLDRIMFVASAADHEDPALVEIPRDLDELEGLINERGDVALVVFDPLVAFIGDNTDTHRDHSTRRALMPLGDFARNTGTAVIGVMHLNKSDGVSLYSRLSMSVAFYNAVRSAALFAEDPDHPDGPYRILAQDKNNLALKAEPSRWKIEPVTISDGNITVETSKLTYVGIADVDAGTLLAGSASHDAPKAGIANELIEKLWVEHQGPVPVSAVRQQLDDFNKMQPMKDYQISFKTCQRSLKRLGGTSRREGFGPESVVKWVPPESYFHE